MRADALDHDPADTRLGQLQRGRGAGFRAALEAGAAAVDDVLQCVLEDPRRDPSDARERYYAELVVALDVPLAPLLAHLAGREVALGHGVLAGAWRLGQPEVRALLAGARSDAALVDGIVAQLYGLRWATLVELPERAGKAFLREALADAECARPSRARIGHGVLPGAMSIPELLELGRRMPQGQRWAVVEELCRRGTEADRVALAATVHDDPVFDRARLAAAALGTLGDERLLPLAIDHFDREDVFADRERRLSGRDRMRRAALRDYVLHLPVDRQLELAREWHGRGGYFASVSGEVFGDRATPDDRARLEAFVGAHADDDADLLREIAALGRIGDPRSAPLLVEVVAGTRSSLARRRALQALAAMPQVPAAAAALREALWDSEDGAAAVACAALPVLDDEARARVGALAGHVLATAELRAAAGRRLAGSG